MPLHQLDGLEDVTEMKVVVAVAAVKSLMTYLDGQVAPVSSISAE